MKEPERRIEEAKQLLRLAEIGSSAEVSNEEMVRLLLCQILSNQITLLKAVKVQLSWD